jgi:hypothetical protein
MQGKTVAGLVVAAMMLATVPLSPAEAHDGRHGGGNGEAIGLGLLGAAVVGSVAVLAAGAQPAPVYAPPPVYYAPPPVYYAPPPVYYAPPPAVYYAPGYYYRR